MFNRKIGEFPTGAGTSHATRKRATCSIGSGSRSHTLPPRSPGGTIPAGASLPGGLSPTRGRGHRSLTTRLLKPGTHHRSLTTRLLKPGTHPLQHANLLQPRQHATGFHRSGERRHKKLRIRTQLRITCCLTNKVACGNRSSPAARRHPGHNPCGTPVPIRAAARLPPRCQWRK